MMIDAAGERSEQGRSLSKSPDSSNAVLAGAALDLAWHSGQDETPQFNLAAGIVDVDADQRSLRVVVQHDAFGDFPAIDAGLLGEIDVQGIGVRMVVQLH